MLPFYLFSIFVLQHLVRSATLSLPQGLAPTKHRANHHSCLLCVQVMVEAWWHVQAYHCRTWSLSNSIPQVTLEGCWASGMCMGLGAWVGEGAAEATLQLA